MYNFIDNLLKIDPYQIIKTEKNELFRSYFEKLNDHHYDNCNEYKVILDNLKFIKSNKNLESYPMLPINIFKDYN